MADSRKGYRAQSCIISSNLPEQAVQRAYALAKELLCEGKDAKPCGRCAHCRKIAARIHPDVIFLERFKDDKGRPKTAITVDQIRNLVSDAAILPNEAERKVYIIDRADTMNTEAQNAALKLLEEPPAGAVFLLCTVNAMALLPTVRSRCTEISCQGESLEADKELAEQAEAYLKAVASGNRVQLLRCCLRLEEMDIRGASAFFDCLGQLLADMLCSRRKSHSLPRERLMALRELCDECAAMLKVNTGAKHIFGLLAVKSIPADGNRGNSID